MRRFPTPRLRWWHAALAVVAGAALVVVLVVVDFAPDEQPEPGPPEDAPRTLVSIGDSTLSGDGIGEYTEGTDGLDGNWCRRSPLAEIHRTDVPGVDETVNLACSGATTEHVRLGDRQRYGEPSQAQQLTELARTNRVVGVVVAIGANDEPRFSSRVRDCIQAYFTESPCNESLAPEWSDIVAEMVPDVEAALSDVRTALADAHYDTDDYQLVLQSYAPPIAPDIPAEVRNLNGCPFLTQDLEWLSSQAVTELNDGLRAAAGEAGARFLDLSRASEGREACTGGADPSTEWFTRLTVRFDDLDDADRARQAIRESFHPNAAGHRQFGDCLTQFLTTDAQEAACLVTEDGTLRAAPGVPGS
ncbi:hypothetical protein H0B56_09795 [Haloechinothrix sp. YIM 98757]|uniref:SGNH hydrolase-type esterase domain-containing protein n=1 Tax=Haloechinothrix aidingensis TaxID=2752311 RepID=A0A838A3H9_9PSEU|nr:GDSL-type esterase/lipase family protein [Haloechinothrix aidingensis]MBA0125833.1 hypothetical protein [Haloechinothrix aidingensis]